VSTDRYRIPLAGVVAFLALCGCARVIGLGSGYYEVSAEVGAGSGSAGTSSGGSQEGGGILDAGGTIDSGGTIDGGGTADSGGISDGGGTAGTGGIPDGPICREHPITAKSTWVATASSQATGNPASNLIDNSANRWSTGKPQSGNEWLQIDFGRSVYLRRINLQQGANMDSNDYPRMYSVYVSDIDNDLNGDALASGVGSAGVTTTIELAKPFLGRYLLITQLGSSISWWSVDELEASCFDGALGSVSP
jgi:hypothetical protein